MQLNQVHAVVTGGASGMGKATTEAIVAAGGKVCIVDYNKDWGEEIAQALGDSVCFEFADVSDPERAGEIMKSAVQKFGYINVVVACAGVGSGTRILPREGGVFPLDTFKRVLDIHLIGSFNYLCQGALAMTEAPEFEDGERGVILLTSSQAADHGQIGQAAYSASKGAIEAIILPTARELARIGVRVNAIQPGLVNTNISSVNQESMPKQKHDHLPEREDEPRAKHYVFPRRQGKATEFASFALEIIKNTMINGAVLRFDGAMRFAPKW